MWNSYLRFAGDGTLTAQIYAREVSFIMSRYFKFLIVKLRRIGVIVSFCLHFFQLKKEFAGDPSFIDVKVIGYK